ncbi:hypothetical protein NPIL_273991 [Nephila pilipes]|uniref:Uncharacterized protein n=1 Tax=Nephila pilipes TaxID=299642 RepID=A0A8X6MEU7_NEPPI|nr:hypothetical protein NPIL_273991 [Nephila pilipes]
MVNSVFSIELLAQTKIAIHTYSDTYITAFQPKKRYILSFGSAKQWEPIMKKKLSSLNLPLKFEKRIKAFMKPLTAQMDEWKFDHNSSLKYCSFEVSIE